RHLGLMQFHTSTLLASMVHNLKTALSLKRKYGLA
ncbi:IS5/IS1182 family transposase, partial [Xanthomonas citri pv. citri]